MLRSKTLGIIIITMSAAGAVLSGILLAAPPAAPVVTQLTPTQPIPDTVKEERVTPAPAPTQDTAEDTAPEQNEPEVRKPKPTTPQTTPLVTVPAVDFTAPIAETQTKNGVVTPPDFQHIFRITDVNAKVYTTHSCRYDHCLGNTLFNIRTGEVHAQKGQELWVNGKRHTITEIRKVKKDELPYDTVWLTEGVGVITCFQNKDYTPSTHNLVIIAQPKP